ncbi:MAG: TolC family protein [Flavobacterium sp.]
MAIISVLCFADSFGQKNLSLQDCENLFQKNNLLLLSEQFAVSAADAAVIQAKIWEHPYFEADMNLYNPSNNHYFDIGEKGQKQFSVQQLIYLGGKKRNEVRVARSNAKLAQLQYEQLLRNLVLETRKNFYSLYFDLNKYKSIESQLSYLEDLIGSYNTQTEKGNIALKDLVRLQSLALSFKSDLLEIRKSILENQENLKILTNSEETIIPVIDTMALAEKLNKTINYLEPQLQELALEKNPEYLSSLTLIENSELMVKWQKSLSVPDVTLGANYDQRSGAFDNQLNFSVGIPLPLWNKNKGAIKVAKAELQQNQLLKDQKSIELKAQISSALQLFLFQQKQYRQSENGSDNLENRQQRNAVQFPEKKYLLNRIYGLHGKLQPKHSLHQPDQERSDHQRRIYKQPDE